MSATRQQRRQQLLNELESVRTLLQEPSDSANETISADSIPVLSDVIPTASAATSPSPQPPFPSPVVLNQSASVEALQINAQHDVEIAQIASVTAAPAADAMQLLIAKLTQRPAASAGADVATEAPLEPASTRQNDPAPELLFTPVSPAALTEKQPAADLLFQAVTETPVFQAPTFTELELRQPQFTAAAPAEIEPVASADNDINDSETTAEQTANTAQVVTAEDVEQLLFDIMPAVEELLRERLTRLLLKT